MIRRIIQIPNILDHKTYIFCPVLRPPFENRTIRQPDMFGPFEYKTSPVFRWLLYLIIDKLALTNFFFQFSDGTRVVGEHERMQGRTPGTRPRC